MGRFHRIPIQFFYWKWTPLNSYSYTLEPYSLTYRVSQWEWSGSGSGCWMGRKCIYMNNEKCYHILRHDDYIPAVMLDARKPLCLQVAMCFHLSGTRSRLSHRSYCVLKKLVPILGGTKDSMKSLSFSYINL